MNLPRLILPLLLAAAPACAAVFQFAIPVETQRRDKPGSTTAFLWVPPEAKQIRGVLMAGMTLAEREMVKDEHVRAECADQSLAIIFLKAGLASADIQKVLDDSAKASGYRELSVAPLAFFGHSAAGPQVRELAIKFADRCFALIQYRGGAPGGEPPVPAGIPTLTMMGQFDEFWGTMRDEEGKESWERAVDWVKEYRAADPANLASMVVEPGAGHFAWSGRNAKLVALFLRKAAQARIPHWPADASEPVACKKVDAASGWVTSFALREGAEPVALADADGEKAGGAWHFDREMAEAIAAYHEGLGKKDQFIRWKDRAHVDAGVRYFFSDVQWVGDGRTFQVHPEYLEKYPEPQPNGPKWPQAGQPVSHSDAPILLKAVSGPVAVAGSDQLRITFDNLSPATEGGRITFMAYSEGDETHRHTEQVGMLPRNFKGFTAGKEQTITFPPVGDIKAGSGPVELKAESSAGLPVDFYVAHGPAEVVDGKLKIADLPTRASLPVEVKIVAHQFGSGIEPKVKTAAPVEQTLRIVQ